MTSHMLAAVLVIVGVLWDNYHLRLVQVVFLCLDLFRRSLPKVSGQLGLVTKTSLPLMSN